MEHGGICFCLFRCVFSRRTCRFSPTPACSFGSVLAICCPCTKSFVCGPHRHRLISLLGFVRAVVPTCDHVCMVHVVAAASQRQHYCCSLIEARKVLVVLVVTAAFSVFARYAWGIPTEHRFVCHCFGSPCDDVIHAASACVARAYADDVVR